MAYVSSKNFPVLINGSPTSFLKSSRGLRQRFSSSPFIFLLVVEGLSHLILKAQEEGILKGIKVVDQLSLLHFLFVDDVLIFGEGMV